MLENPTDWKVLRSFCKTPTRGYFVKELSRELGISPSSSSTVCKELFGAGILSQKRMGNLLIYRLDNDSFLAREAKKFVFLAKLHKYRELFEDGEYQAVALYGSYSSGEYIEKSDIDLLVVTNVEKNKVRRSLEALRGLGEVSLTVMGVSGWLEMKRKTDPFYKEVVANHTLLHGQKLVI